MLSPNLHITILPISQTALQRHSWYPRPQMVRYGREMVEVDEVVSILLSSGMTVPEVLEWLERRLEVGRFAKKEQR